MKKRCQLWSNPFQLRNEYEQQRNQRRESSIEMISENHLFGVETYTLPDMRDLIFQGPPTAGPLAKLPPAADPPADETKEAEVVSENESHEMKLPQAWEQRKPLIYKSFGREMVGDSAIDICLLSSSPAGLLPPPRIPRGVNPPLYSSRFIPER
jgi:hypothetical protein